MNNRNLYPFQNVEFEIFFQPFSVILLMLYGMDSHIISSTVRNELLDLADFKYSFVKQNLNLELLINKIGLH